MSARPLALAAFGAGLLLSACGPAAEPEPPPPAAADTTAAEAPATPARPALVEGAGELLGDWVIMEQAGAAPEEGYVVSFTPTGGYLLRSEGGQTARKTFEMAGPNRIAVTDSEGTRHFLYETDGARLSLTIPGTENTTVLERYERIHSAPLPRP